MKKSGQMKDRVRDRLEEIHNEEDFVTSILSSLKNDYECEHLLRLIGRYNVQTPDNVLLMAVIISNAQRRAPHGNGGKRAVRQQREQRGRRGHHKRRTV